MIVGKSSAQVGAVFALESAALGLVAPWHVLVASCVVLPVLVAGALTSTRRSTRFTVLEAIRAGSPSPPNSRLARAAAPSVMPLTIGLGLKDLLARGRRALLLAAAIALSGAVVVIALSVDASLDAQPAGKTSDVPDELPLLIYTLDATLLVITATTLVVVAATSLPALLATRISTADALRYE